MFWVNLNCRTLARSEFEDLSGRHSPVDADLVKLNVSLADAEHDQDEYITILCAVCDDANDDLVLSSNVQDDLFHKSTQKIVDNVTAQHDDSSNDSNDVINEMNDDHVKNVTDDTVHVSDTHNVDNVTPDCTLHDSNVDAGSSSVESYDQLYSQRKANAETMRQEQPDDETLKRVVSPCKTSKIICSIV